MKTYSFGTLAAVAALIVSAGPAMGQTLGYPPQAYGSAGSMDSGQASWYQGGSGQPAYASGPYAQGPAAAYAQQPQMTPYAPGYAGAYPVPQDGSGNMGYPMPTPAEGEPLAAATCGGDCYCPRWTASADVVYLQRFGGAVQTLITGSTGTTLAQTSDLNFNWAGGPRIDIIRHGDTHWDVEFSYFLVDGSNASVTAGDPAGTSANVGGVVFSTAGFGTELQYTYLARLYSGEVNFRHAVSKNLTFLFGFRAVELTEDFNGVLLASGAPIGSFIHTQTDNHLYGFQMGADGTLWAPKDSPLRIDGLVKAGVYDDHATQESDSQLNSETASAVADHLALLGEAAISASYQIGKHVAVHAGYQTIWLQSVALAPNQLMSTRLDLGTAKVDMSGGLFYHGAFGGLEIDF